MSTKGCYSQLFFFPVQCLVSYSGLSGEQLKLILTSPEHITCGPVFIRVFSNNRDVSTEDLGQWEQWKSPHRRKRKASGRGGRTNGEKRKDTQMKCLFIWNAWKCLSWLTESYPSSHSWSKHLKKYHVIVKLIILYSVWWSKSYFKFWLLLWILKKIWSYWVCKQILLYPQCTKDSYFWCHLLSWTVMSSHPADSNLFNRKKTFQRKRKQEIPMDQ